MSLFDPSYDIFRSCMDMNLKNYILYPYDLLHKFDHIIKIKLSLTLLIRISIPQLNQNHIFFLNGNNDNEICSFFFINIICFYGRERKKNYIWYLHNYD